MICCFQAESSAFFCFIPTSGRRDLIRQKSFKENPSMKQQIGLPEGTVRVVPHSPMWRWIFQFEKVRLKTLLGTYALDIQHIGSTAVRGMAAKPIIDILLAVRDYQTGWGCTLSLRRNGYRYFGESQVLNKFLMSRGEPPCVYLYIVGVSSMEHLRYISFRDILCKDRALAQRYAYLKRELASRYSSDRRAYYEGKKSFIESVLETNTTQEHEDDHYP